MRSAGGLALVAACAAGCVDMSEQCPGPHTYRMYVSTDSAREACTIMLSAGDRSFAYEFSAIGACRAKAEPISCMPGEGSPTPSSCEVWPCGLLLFFHDADGAALVEALGADRFTMTVTCDGERLETNRIEAENACSL
jgi:hypothetical protein